MNRIHRIAYALFGKKIKKDKDNYGELRLAIRQSRLGVPWDIYVSTAYLASVLAVVFCLVTGYMLMPLWRFLYFNYLKIAPYTGNKIIGSHGEIIFSLVIIIFIALILGFITYSLIMAYP